MINKVPYLRSKVKGVLYNILYAVFHVIIMVLGVAIAMFLQPYTLAEHVTKECTPPLGQERFYTDVSWLPEGSTACGCFIGVDRTWKASRYKHLKEPQ